MNESRDALEMGDSQAQGDSKNAAPGPAGITPGGRGEWVFGASRAPFEACRCGAGRRRCENGAHAHSMSTPMHNDAKGQPLVGSPPPWAHANISLVFACIFL